MLNHTTSPTIEFPEDMDPECIALCAAINHLPGVETVESCCGHGERRFRVWLKARMQYDLSPLLYHAMYAGEWRLQASTDGTMNPVTYMLVGPVMGQEGDWGIEQLVSSIRTWLAEDEERVVGRTIAPRRVVRTCVMASAGTYRVSLQIGHYGHALGLFMTLFELAKVDFPGLVLGDVEVVQYGGERIHGHWGIEFHAPDAPEDYTRVEFPEPTL